MFWILALLLSDAPFSHKTHAPLKMACTQCHAGAQEKVRAGFPLLSQCQTCHRGLAAVFPSKRVYKMPDFVIFSHAAHAKAKTSCAVCHGEVSEQQALTKFRPTTMKACVDCHKERQATQDCTACHELGQ